MKTLLLSAFVGLAMLLPAAARIGETPAQCEARYGRPLKIDKATACIWYRKGGIEVLVFFYQGKADALILCKVEKDAIGTSVAMTSTEVEVILKANGNGKEWKVKPVPGANKTWHADEEIYASYDATKNQLMLLTDAWGKRNQQESAAKEKANLNGF